MRRDRALSYGKILVGNGFIRSAGAPCGMHKCIPYGGGSMECEIRAAGGVGPYGLPLRGIVNFLGNFSAGA